VRVLFVDDNAMNRTVVRNMLDAAGLDMAEAGDAVTGLAMIDAHDYDLLLIDLRMPGMDGLAAIGQIRARRDHKAALPIIVVTADAAPNIREQAIAAGADELLAKPIQMQGLFDAAAKVMTQRNCGVIDLV
jgi:CheY-like chemotaxis protein